MGYLDEQVQPEERTAHAARSAATSGACGGGACEDAAHPRVEGGVGVEGYEEELRANHRRGEDEADALGHRLVAVVKVGVPVRVRARVRVRVPVPVRVRVGVTLTLALP